MVTGIDWDVVAPAAIVAQPHVATHSEPAVAVPSTVLKYMLVVTFDVPERAIWNQAVLASCTLWGPLTLAQGSASVFWMETQTLAGLPQAIDAPLAPSKAV